MAAYSPSNSSLSFHEGDIDRKVLREIKRRFLAVNAERIKRALSLQTPRQKRFLELLPLLLHVNHPLFPGYVNKDTPVGVTAYKPDRIALQQARSLSRSFRYNPRHQAYGDIHSIFLMGSTGTIAQSNASDLDIWICYRSDLLPNELELLEKKLHLISRWGASLNLEANFFLMDSQKFRLGLRQGLSTEDCGSSQHYLLLDEFYRTALLLAGRYPIWWLIPPEEDARYTEISNTLIDKRYIPDNESIDFGNTDQIPAGEFIGAGMWQLYKGVDAAHKSILKISLTEVYAQEHPHVGFLSTEYKKAIYANRLDANELDPYVMVYRKLERYLQDNNEAERLELVRRCLYFKANIPLSKHRASQRSWRGKLLSKLVSQWQWDEGLIKRLDDRYRWNIQSIMQEREALVAQLTHSYQFLANFAQQHSESDDAFTINQADMASLGRKLYAAFERKGGKLELVNPNITHRVSEDPLTFYYDDQNKSVANTWALYLGQHTLEQLVFHRPLKRSQSFIELIAWCYFNRIVNASSRLSLHAESSDLDKIAAQRIIQSFEKNFPLDSYRETLNRFEESAYIAHSALFLNVGLDPFAQATEKGLSRLSMRTDPLSYSGLKDNLTLSVDQVNINSWGEIFTSRFTGENAVLNCLLEYLQSQPQQINPDAAVQSSRLYVHCFSATRSQSIAERIQQLFKDVATHYQRKQNVRYILEIDRTYHLLHLQAETPWMESFPSTSGLLDALNKPQPTFSPIVLDRETDSLPALALICHHNQAELLQIFYRPGPQQTEIYIADPKGAVYFGHVYSGDETSLLAQLQRFTHTTLYRQSTESADQPLITQNQHLQCFKICGNKNGRRLFLETKNLPSETKAARYYSVQAIAELDAKGQVVFSIFCDSTAFTQVEYGKNLFNAVSKHILKHRKSQQLYPCYITDLDLSSIKHKLGQGNVFSISQYFQFKFKLEQALNQALFSHSSQ
jgi:adenylate cyclase class 1